MEANGGESHARFEFRFEWDPEKDALNREKHGVSFEEAQRAFADPRRVIETDDGHSAAEDRYFCYGNVDGEILTVRFTERGKTTRIFGAGIWRKGRRIYEKENALYGRSAGN
jgi:uncharacterized DUF497 family protein